MYFKIQTGGARTRVHGTGLSQAFQFAIDVGGSFNINRMQLPQLKYSFRVTPPNHFTIGRLAEESSSSYKYTVGDPKYDSIIKVCDFFLTMTMN